MDGLQATGHPIAYHPTISLPPDDVASRLERLLDEHLLEGDAPTPAVTMPDDPALEDAVPDDPAPDEATATPPVAIPETPPEPPVAAVREVIDDQLDELRGQLDEAFNEMADLINRTERRALELGTTIEAHAEARAHADDDLASRLVADRLHLEAALDQLRRDVIAWRDAPVTVDTRHLEEAVQQGALHNAADIANMARDVDNLGKVLRLQDERLTEIHTTLDWIKQRILNR